MAELEVFGFENEDIKGGIYDKYKGKKNQTDRVAIVYTDPKAMFAGSKIHFKDRFFLCKKGKCCEALGPAKWRVGAVLIKYSTDRNGMPKKPFEYSLYPWVFSEQTYIKLKNTNSEFPLATHDIKISCTNEEYQHLDIIPCNESIWTAKEELRTAVLEQAKPIWEYVKKSIASDLSVEEINDLLGISSAVAGADPTSKIDLDSVLDKI
jgi:hypothetical protein